MVAVQHSSVCGATPADTRDSACSRGNDMLLLLARRIRFQQIDQKGNTWPIVKRLGLMRRVDRCLLRQLSDGSVRRRVCARPARSSAGAVESLPAAGAGLLYPTRWSVVAGRVPRLHGRRVAHQAHSADHAGESCAARRSCGRLRPPDRQRAQPETPAVAARRQALQGYTGRRGRGRRRWCSYTGS